MQELTGIISNDIRHNDIFVRWGGEEFVLLFEEMDIKRSYEKCEEFRQRVQDTNFVNDIKLTLSFGVTLIRKDDDVKSLLKRADDLLYQAKDEGRNKIRVNKKNWLLKS